MTQQQFERELEVLGPWDVAVVVAALVLAIASISLSVLLP